VLVLMYLDRVYPVLFSNHAHLNPLSCKRITNRKCKVFIDNSWGTDDSSSLEEIPSATPEQPRLASVFSRPTGLLAAAKAHSQKDPSAS